MPLAKEPGSGARRPVWRPGGRVALLAFVWGIVALWLLFWLWLASLGGGPWLDFLSGIVLVLVLGVSLLCWLRRLVIAALFALLYTLVAAALMITGPTWSTPRRVPLAADQGTIAALRSAIAIYYGRHGVFPRAPQMYVPGFVLHCRDLRYSYDRETGEVHIVSTNTVADCP